MTADATTGSPEPRLATAAPLRWLAAIICIFYGFAKLNGSQFTVLDSELTRPLGAVSGFWLTWHYFGYSVVYGTTVALLQIVGGVLLVLPRTALLAALVLLPIFANIFLVDVAFGIGLQPTVVALIVLGCLSVVIAPHVTRLRAVLLLDAGPRRGVSRNAILAAVIVGAWAFTWWVANYNNRRPTPIDGIWSVVSQSGNHPAWREVFFEHNRAFWVVFRAADGTDERHHFEVDQQGVVRVWQTWLTKGDLILEGRLDEQGQLVLENVGETEGGRVVLQRRTSAVKPTNKD